jgi:hypothetical protein
MRAARDLGNSKHAHPASGGGLARRSRRGPVAAALLLAVALFPPAAALAAMYKWVDDKGVVHYTDQVPPDAVNKGNVQLSPQGIPIRKVAPATTPEERKAREAQLEREQETAKEQAKEQTEIARRDRALLESYTTASDIDLAKSRAIRTLQAALQSAQGYSAQLTKRKSALAERKAAYAGKPVPADIDREMAGIDAELGRQGAIVAQKNQQIAEVAAKYDADKARWQVLAGGGAGATSPATGAAAAPAPPPVSRK